MSTQTIAGQTITLESGVRYYASRPFAERHRLFYPVTFAPIGCGPDGPPTVTLDGLTYEDANALINAFNNGAFSFDGRVW